MVLIHIAASVACPVESYALCIGLVVIFRQPVCTCSRDVAPWLRAIMVCPCEDMMEAEWHHVVDCGFARGHHHVEDRLDEVWIGCECLLEPFLRYLLRCQGHIPCHTAESVP